MASRRRAPALVPAEATLGEPTPPADGRGVPSTGAASAGAVPGTTVLPLAPGEPTGPVPTPPDGPAPGATLPRQQVPAAAAAGDRTAGERALAALRRATRGNRLRRGVALVSVVVATLALSSTLVGLRMAHHPQLDRTDEAQHMDYVDRLASGHYVHQSDDVRPETLALYCTHGYSGNDVTQACRRQPYLAYRFPFRGYQYETVQGPVYYGVTAVVRNAFLAVGLTGDRLVASRAVGALWLGAGALLVGALALTLGASRAGAAAAGGYVLASPALVRGSSYVTNDAAMVAAGALVLLAAVAYQRGRLRWWWLAAACAVAVSCKTTGFVAAMLAALFLLWAPRSWRDRHRLVGVAATAGGTVLATGLVAGVTLLLSHGPDRNPLAHYLGAGPLTLNHVLYNARAVIDALQVPEVAASPMGVMLALTTPLLFAAPLAGALASPRPGRVAAARLGIATWLSILVAGPLLAVVLYLGQHVSGNVTARYGLVLVPGLLAAGAGSLGRRGAAVGAAVVALQGLVLVLTLVGNDLV